MEGNKTKHLILSEKEKEDLNGYLGILPEIIRPWIPEKYRKVFSDKSKWPIFYYRTYTGLDQMMETDFLTSINIDNSAPKTLEETEEEIKKKISEKKISSSAMIIYRLQRCITGCRNFFDEKGDEIAFENEIIDGAVLASKNFIAKLPYMIQMELFKVITKGLELSEDDKLGLDF